MSSVDPVVDDVTIVQAKLMKLLEDAKAAVADKKITWDEAWAIIGEVKAIAVEVVDTLKKPGPEKKAMVVALCDKLYESILKPIDIPYVPNLIEPRVDDIIGKIFHNIVSGLIEGDVKLLRLRQAKAATSGKIVGFAGPG